MKASVRAAQTSGNELNSSLHDKYSQLCRDFDEQRVAADKQQAGLYKTLLRLAFAFKGRSDDLDTQLLALRDALREGLDAKQRNRRIDEVVAAIVALPDPEESRADTALLLELLERLQLPDSKSFELKQIKSRLANGGDPTTLVASVAELITDPATEDKPHHDEFAEFLAALSLPGETGEGIDRLRGRLEAARDGRARLQVVDSVLELLNEPQIRGAPERDDPCDVLHALMDWVLFPGEFEKPAAQLRAQLQESKNDWDPIRATANLFNELQAFLRRDLRELEGYLKKATVQLSDLEGQLQGALASSALSVADSKELSSDIGAEMEQITGAVDAGASGSELKHLVDQRVDAISGSMHTFLSVQNDRQHGLRKAHRTTD